MDASQYRFTESRKVVARSIRRSTQAASPGVGTALVPQVEAAPFFAPRRLRKVAARIIGMCVTPLLHQRLQFGVVPVRQHDPGRDQEVAASSRFRQSLAFET